MKKILLLIVCLVSINAYAQIPTNGLMGYYMFNNNFSDSSSSHKHASPTSPFYGGGVDNKARTAASFKGSSYAFTQNSFDYRRKTVSIWLKPTDFNNITMVLCADHPGLTNGLFYINIEPNAVSKNLRISQGNAFDTLTIEADVWSHLVITVDSPNYKIYINGNIVKTGARTSNLTSNAGWNGTVIGSNRVANGNYFKGYLDNLRIYNRVLDSVELLQLKHEFTPNCLVTDTIKIIHNTHVNVYDTTHVAVFDTTHVAVFDTTHVAINDTTFVSVTDTLYINALLSGMNPPQFSEIKIYPNPTHSNITIEVANLNSLVGYQIKIVSMLGATVYQANINQANNVINFSNWTGIGTYTLQLIDPQNNVIANKKIIFN